MLGVKIHQLKDGISLEQQLFTEALLDQYGMSNCKPVYLESPGLRHWQAFLHVLKYLNGSRNKGLYYPRRKSNGITAFRNAYWGNCQVTRHSTTGYLACFHRCLILWNTRKQPSLSIPTAEAEYKSLCDLTSEIMWFKQWCEEERLLTLREPILIYEDNQASIKTTNGDCNLNNKRLKHVDIQLHFMKEAIQCQIVCLCYIPSAHMIANFLTKSVNKEMLEKSLQELCLLRLGERGDEEISTQKGLGEHGLTPSAKAERVLKTD
ncbi:hypothetical protein O181_097851 [Austropuccinia psidii MF-1]|uniref:Reverse transcriptase Ty1/copia-type domain-containing protein n=1 Tax=Austropuccinia psidii MF-1 TaxID=1389203 RepID=A0A9Q3JA80_9BASI|nr:hypothetical protein [Austropuccinia psidii MF-1]